MINPTQTHQHGMNELVSLCKRRGFIFQNSELYGGLQGIYDYGPLGVELKNNLKAAWWRSMVYERDDVEGLDAAVLSHRLTLQHSGHEDTFTDPMVDCHDCKARLRADQLSQPGHCDQCGSKNLTTPRPFNLMFRTNFGPVDDGTSYAYLRPETAQAIFINFKNVLNATARKLPFGIAQIGKAFRNEVSPRNFIFRVREFEQMELEFFVMPGTDEQWHQSWVQDRLNWWEEQGIGRQNLKLLEQSPDELAHYSKATVDILYRFPHGFEELEGIANRTDFDLGAHTKFQNDLNLVSNVKPNYDSVENLGIRLQDDNRFIIPYVIEPSAGLDRGVLAILAESYTKEPLENGQERVLLKLKPHLAPIKIAVVPLAKNNEKIVLKAKAIKQNLSKMGFGRIKYEDIGNIGKAYRRHDEIGTPFCITVDFETFEKSPETVTVRYRDSMAQERIAVPDLEHFFKQQLTSS